LREGLVRLSEDVHALSYRLHPSILRDLGLAEALKVECESLAELGSIKVKVDVTDVPGGLPYPAMLCLFRIAQEALRNVVRHAAATEVTVTVRRRRDGVQLVVTDNGSGFDPTRHQARPSLGLASMRQRVRLLSGELEIDSAPGSGTTVLARVPVEEAPHETTTRAAGC
jgi:signal transduction histidine kinase